MFCTLNIHSIQIKYKTNPIFSKSNCPYKWIDSLNGDEVVVIASLEKQHLCSLNLFWRDDLRRILIHSNWKWIFHTLVSQTEGFFGIPKRYISQMTLRFNIASHRSSYNYILILPWRTFLRLIEKRNYSKNCNRSWDA